MEKNYKCESYDFSHSNEDGVMTTINFVYWLLIAFGNFIGGLIGTVN